MAQLSLSYGWLDPYINPKVYQQLSIVHFTPIVLSVYKSVLTLFGLNSFAFIALQLILISSISSFASYFCYKITREYTAGFICLLLIYSNVSLLPMLSRFYTVHYLLGALLSIIIIFLVYRAWHFNILKSYCFLIFLFILTFVTLLTKEVYIMLLPILWGFFFKINARKAFFVITVALVCYLSLRFYILGFSSEGRDGENVVSGIFKLPINAWINFFIWYVTNKWLICIAVAIAFFYAPKKTFFYITTAGLFATPSLAAPHAFLYPELHGDRLFFMFDLMLSAISVVIIYTSKNTRVQPPFLQGYYSSVFVFIFLVLIFIQRQSLNEFSNTQVNTASYLINEQLINQLEKSDTVVLTPLSYYMGDIMNINALLGDNWLEIIQDCRQFIDEYKISSDRYFVAFSGDGKRIPLKQVSENCQPSKVEAIIKIPPTFEDGVLSWSIGIPEGFSGGILFPDRGIAIGVPEFKERLARPKPDENYQVYIKRNNEWSVTKMREIQINE